MPAFDESITGAPCWIDLFTSDPDKSRAFYGELFGWTSEAADAEYGGYINFALNGQRVAGGMKNDGSTGQPDAWSIYLATDDINKVAEVAVANGGQVIVAPMAVGELGSMAVLADPGGAAIGAWQPGLHRGFDVMAEPGSPGWFELHTRDFEASVTFYREVFGWQTHSMGDTDEFRYTTLGDADAQHAGIMDVSAFVPEGGPAQWSVYFATADTDATLAKLEQLGGAIVQPAEDTPYGRLASATDPTGALFKLVG